MTGGMALLRRTVDRMESRPADPRLRWRQIARPEQLLPPLTDSWRVIYFQGGRGAGKTRTCSQGLAEIVQGDTDGDGEYGIIGPTYADAWTKCVEGESGILRALGTSMAEVKDHRSAIVRSAWRTYGQVVLHNGITIYIDSAAEGGLRIQGRNLKSIWCVAADEGITTQYGQIPIKDIQPGDYVLTRGGWRRVTDKALTKRRAPVVMLKTDDGHSIRVTPDHKVWTMEAGWVSAGQIRPGTRTLCLVSRATSNVLSANACSIPQGSEHASALLSTAQPSTVISVEPSGHSDVYDLTVNGRHEFFASNILVKNCDEIGLWEKWETAWKESIRFAVRHGVSKIICDGTPKASRPARRLIRSLIKNDPEEGGVIVRRLRTADNAANLSDAFYRAVIGAAKGTRLERQELEGELLDDVANALWTRDLLENIQCRAVGPEYLRRTHIGVDPSDGSEDSDEQAYTIMGLGPAEDGHIYVAENWGGQEAPAPFAKRVILTAIKWDATIAVEKNHGGKWLETVFQQVMKELVRSGVIGVHDRRPRVELIHASDAKRTRAEPVAALYERYGGELVQHCRKESLDRDGHVLVEGMTELEDQMATFTGAAGERSPDRLDSLVWAANAFLTMELGRPVAAGVRKWAATAELDAIGLEPLEIMRRRRLANVHGGLYEGSEGWDLDSFGPKSADDDRNGSSNRREWR